VPRALKILVVDDNADAADSLAALLKLLGHEAQCVTDSRLAISAALQMNPNVAFLDIGMPHINGYELAATLRKTFGTKVSLVALTAYGSAADREMSRVVGFDAHLLKPAEFHMIEAALNSLFPKGWMP
jgi:CheY-like chemotaxis protein